VSSAGGEAGGGAYRNDPLQELARLWRDVARQGEHVVLPATVTAELELRALAYQAALAAGARVLHPGLVEFLGQ
jgi:predicted kinase